MTHDELLKLMQTPDFVLAKDMIMQGLSVKLNNYEVSAGAELLINLRPRDVTQAQNEMQQPVQDQTLAPGQGINPMKTFTQQDTEKRIQDGTMPTQSSGQNFAKTMNPYMKPGQAQQRLADERMRLSAFPNQASAQYPLLGGGQNPMSQSFQIGGPLGSAGKANAARAPQAHKQSEQQFASTMPQNKQIVQPTEFLFEYNFDE